MAIAMTASLKKTKRAGANRPGMTSSNEDVLEALTNESSRGTGVAAARATGRGEG
jgi:hypothetical protein